VVTLIVAEPGATALTSPFASTVAIEGALLTQVAACVLALEGFTVAFSK
jgi:hypothetical protein